MIFDQWWATLTAAEQKILGKTNARFVWQQALESLMNNPALLRQLHDAATLSSLPGGLKNKGESK